MEGKTLTRRSFVKAAAAATASVAAASSMQTLVEADEAYAATESTGKVEIVHTVCRACIAQCTVLAHVRDGRVIKLEGDPDGPMSRGSMCAKGLSGIQALYNPNRNKYPMIRVGERGRADNFKRVSWDEATDYVADKLMEVYNKYGPESVVASTGGGGNPHISGPIRFINTFGSPNNFEPGCAQCYLPRQTQARLVYGGGPDDNQSIADSNVLEFYYTDTEARAAVLWGAGPSWSGPSMTGRAIADLKARPEGLKTVVIDPRCTADASHADVWLPIRVGTDVALMMCWIKYIIDNKLYDEDFDKKWTNLPFLVDPDTKYCLKADVIGGSADDYVVYDTKTQSVKAMPYPYPDDYDVALFGEYDVNGKKCKTGYQVLKEACDEWTLAKAAEVCWLDAKKIEEAIHIYTDNCSTLIHGLATDQFVGSAQATLAALTLDCMMGHIQCPGAGLQDFGKLAKGKSGIIHNDTFGMGCIQNAISRDMLNKRLVGGHNGFYNWQMAHIPTVLNAVKTGQPYKPRVWMERSGNKLAVLGNARSWYEARDEFEMIVHAYMYPTSFTIEMADVVFPLREWLECPKPVQLMNWIFPRREVVHLWETADETLYWSRIVAKLAERGHENAKKCFDASFTNPGKSKILRNPGGSELVGSFEIGVAKGYPWAHTEEQLMDEFMDTQLDPDTGKRMTWDDLLAKGGFEYAPESEWRQYYVYKTIDPATGKPIGFGTPSGRVEPYSEITVKLGRTGYPFSLCNEGLVELDSSKSAEYEPVPYYEEPAENPNDDKEYPLALTEGRVPIYHHGTLRNIPWLREIMPTAEIWVNPKDADKYGITNKGWVKVESRRGETYARAIVTNGIPARMVYQERFWNPELLQSDPYGSWNAMNVNVLTKNDPPYNDVYGTYTLRGFQVKISPVDKNPYDGIWTEPEQFEPWLPLTDTNPGTATSGSWQQLDDTTGTATTVEDNDWCPDPTKM
jgi:anaerobic selenocysteine-containing dehydrogenase